MRPVLALTLAAVLAAGCDSAVSCPGDPSCPEAPGGPGEVVAGVDLAALFAAPTVAERDSVAARLARTGGTDAPRAVRIEATQLATDTDATRYVLLTLTVEGGQTAAFGLARIPSNAFGAGAPLPVLVLLPDGDGRTSEAAFLTGQVAAGLDRETVQIALAARGAGLTSRGVGPQQSSSTAVVRRPDLPAGPYRADILDVLALADLLGTVPRADLSRVALVGVGRGGAVALLAAERRPGRFRAVASLGAPTSLFDPTVRAAVRNELLGLSRVNLPAVDALLAPVRALRAGEVSLDEARLRLLDLSAAPFADRLPATLAFHADPDDVVPTAHLDRLREQGEGSLGARRRFVRVPEGRHEALLATNDVTGVLATFLTEQLRP